MALQLCFRHARRRALRLSRVVPATASHVQLSFDRSPRAWFSTKTLRIFNSLTNEVEPFLQDEHDESNRPIRWYNCGPTVYDSAHLGHARTYVCLDIMRRILTKHFRLDVLYALGLTDIDDKIIKRANESPEVSSPLALARRFETEFFEDLAKLGVELPDVVLRVTEHVDDIVDYVKLLEAKGFAYVNEADNSVYFDVQAFNSANHSYGTMGPTSASLDTEEGRALHNADEGDESGLDRTLKRDPRDFVLWKAAKPDLEPASVQWPSPWGLGRPGWHIECSAMSRAACGSHLDLHSGGIDLKFPHHCNEVAQSEAHNSAPRSCCPGHATDGQNGDPWARFFVHTGHLYIEGLKMSKSLKNFISVRDLLENGFTADSFRMFCLQYSYRSSVHYSPDRMDEANALIRRVQNFLKVTDKHIQQAVIDGQELTKQQCTEVTEEGKLAQTWCSKRWRSDEVRLRDSLSSHRAEIDSALANDFDTPEALQSLLKLTQVRNALSLIVLLVPYLMRCIVASSFSSCCRFVLMDLQDYV